MTDDSISDLQARIRQFASERDWEQFHTPKNLTMALAGEVGELVEIFQWLSPEEATGVMEGPRAVDVEDEIADVFLYLLRLADVLDIDPMAASRSKLTRNEARYPSHQVRGRADHKPS